MDTVGDRVNGMRWCAEIKKTLIGEGTYGNQCVSILDGKLMSLEETRLAESGVVRTYIATVAGDHHRRAALKLVPDGQVGIGIDVMAMYHVVTELTVKAMERQFIPLHKPSRRHEAWVAFNPIGKVVVSGCQFAGWIGTEHDDIVAHVLKLSSQDIDNDFLATQAGKSSIGVQADSHSKPGPVDE